MGTETSRIQSGDLNAPVQARVLSDAVDVSVVIVNWNTRDMLRDCLRSVYEQTRDVSFEVIVVDNASSDDSVSMVRGEFPHVLLIANEKNLGFAAANNQGFERARGRYILMLNPDTVVLDQAIGKSVHYAENAPEAGVVGCRVLWPDGRRQNSCFRFSSVGQIALSSLAFFRMHRLFRWRILHPDRYLNRDFSQEQDVDVVAGCFLLIRRNVLSQVGTLDEDFFMYGEEAEFCHRVHRAGWRVRYFPGAQIIHLYGGSSNQVFHEMSLAKRLAALLLVEKTRGFMHAWACNLFMLLGVLLRLPLWLAHGVFRRGKQGQQVFQGKWPICKAHAAGVFRPIWRRR
ncbi:MAG: glycosyltransferase family 2 protein [Phycisphaerae bacterium]|nr:glycosyltransferase family 2 protein [Phycisphaerae bacterium]